MSKKKTTRRTYPLELKKKAVAMTNEPGMTVKEVATQLDVPSQQLSQWRQKLNGAQAARDAEKRLDAVAEARELREQLKQAQMEIDILKKAASYFASQK